MFTHNQKNAEKAFVDLTDWRAERPKGKLTFYAYVTFNDYSYCLRSNIFAKDLASAWKIVLKMFASDMPYIWNISVAQSEV